MCSISSLLMVNGDMMRTCLLWVVTMEKCTLFSLVGSLGVFLRFLFQKSNLVLTWMWTMRPFSVWYVNQTMDMNCFSQLVVWISIFFSCHLLHCKTKSIHNVGLGEGWRQISWGTTSYSRACLWCYYSRMLHIVVIECRRFFELFRQNSFLVVLLFV